MNLMKDASKNRGTEASKEDYLAALRSYSIMECHQLLQISAQLGFQDIFCSIRTLYPLLGTFLFPRPWLRLDLENPTTPSLWNRATPASSRQNDFQEDRIAMTVTGKVKVWDQGRKFRFRVDPSNLLDEKNPYPTVIKADVAKARHELPVELEKQTQLFVFHSSTSYVEVFCVTIMRCPKSYSLNNASFSNE